MASSAKRAYDPTRRRERAEAERQETRRRVVDAARRLFLARGYRRTTIADIAKEARVALQSVYNAGQSKAELLHHVVDLAVAGDDDELMYVDRPIVTAVADEPDPKRQVELIAELIVATLERLAPVWTTYREAAAVDPKAAEELIASHRRRHETFAGVASMLAEDHLRRPLPETIDTMWAIGSVDVFLLLRSLLGWDEEQYADWLKRTLVVQLLRPAEDSPG